MTDRIAELEAESSRLAAERDAFRDQRNGVIKDNERLIERAEQSVEARLHAENATRTAQREIARLKARVAELEAAQDSFLLPWAYQLDAKSLDNFTIDLTRAADAPLMIVVDEIHQTVAQWRELVAKRSTGAVTSDGR
ncbi:hypothetical protein AB0M92_18760 [Streptomyces sp. NPDC051582]|uniref:hypothetical protein n=1 Tax=Streptomyces sp. NPDC051582 TaxID=3155167 RepID=UPI00343EBF0F